MLHKTLIATSLLLVTAGSIACSQPDTPPADDRDTSDSADASMTADMANDATMSPVDMPDPDDSADMRARSDMADMADMSATPDMAPPACEWPAHVIAGTPETDAVAGDAARCGQPAHAWLKSDQIGAVTGYGEKQRITARLLEGVLKSQDVTLTEELVYDARVEQFSYMTQDRGELIEATAAVGIPEGIESPRGIILVLHGTTGFTDECAPSKSLEGQALLALFASIGYVAVAPDYIGMKGFGDRSPEIHPYLVGQSVAISSLDAIRALPNIESAKRGDLCPSPEVLVFGGSQGGHAALWVDRLQPYYAREIELLGTVATVPPTDLTNQLVRALKMRVSATANTIAFFGASSGWYGHQDKLDEVFRAPYDEDVPAALYGGCEFGDLVDGDTTLEEVFTERVLNEAAQDTLATFEPWSCMAAENSLLETSIPRINEDPEGYGILMVYGENDTLVDTPTERAAYPRFCEEQDIPSTYIECAGAGHGPATFHALPEIFSFFDDRVARRPFIRSCETPAAARCQGAPSE